MNPAMTRHLQTLGLERAPFPPTPDAAAWFQTTGLEAELAEAAHCLRTRAGFVLLTGEVGTGKSTFLRRLLLALDGEGVVTSMVFNTFLQGADLLAAVNEAYLVGRGSSLAANAGFTKGMTAGKGYIALAALIFAKWRPKNILFACLLFGFLQAVGNFAQGASVGGFQIPVQFINMLPYVLTVVLLAGFIGKSVPPKASGLPYTKDR